MSKIDKQSALSQCVCALAEILENLIQIQSECLGELKIKNLENLEN